MCLFLVLNCVCFCEGESGGGLFGFKLFEIVVSVVGWVFCGLRIS